MLDVHFDGAPQELRWCQVWELAAANRLAHYLRCTESRRTHPFKETLLWKSNLEPQHTNNHTWYEKKTIISPAHLFFFFCLWEHVLRTGGLEFAVRWRHQAANRPCPWGKWQHSTAYGKALPHPLKFRKLRLASLLVNSPGGNSGKVAAREKLLDSFFLFFEGVLKLLCVCAPC